MRESSVENREKVHEMPYWVTVYGDVYLTPQNRSIMMKGKSFSKDDKESSQVK
mgnify:CR=1 FL=1